MLRIASLDEHCETTRYDQLSQTMLVDLSARSTTWLNTTRERPRKAAIATSGMVHSRSFPASKVKRAVESHHDVGGGRRRSHGVPW